MPDDYLEHLDGLGIETTITAAELCAIGTWERVGGGYRILDWEAVEHALDGVRQRSGEDPAPSPRNGTTKPASGLTWPSRSWSPPPCAACGAPAARIELVPPGQLPAGWDHWPGTVQASIMRRREPGQWYLRFQGIATCNGYGDPIDASRAGRITQVFRPPLCFAQVHTAGFYDDAGFCQDCDAPYCHQHWHVSELGCGHCPRGHGTSLDPHW